MAKTMREKIATFVGSLFGEKKVALHMLTEDEIRELGVGDSVTIKHNDKKIGAEIAATDTNGIELAPVDGTASYAFSFKDATGKVLTASKTADEKPEQAQTEDDQDDLTGQVVPLESKPQKYDQKVKKYDEEFKNRLKGLSQRDDLDEKREKPWRKAEAKDELPLPFVCIKASRDGNSRKFYFIEEDLDSGLKSLADKGFRPVQLISHKELNVLLGAEEAVGEPADTAFDFAIEQMKSGIPIEEAVEMAKNQIEESSPVDTFIEGVRKIADAKVISILVDAQVKFHSGPSKYLRRIANLHKATGKTDLTYVEIQPEDYEESEKVLDEI